MVHEVEWECIGGKKVISGKQIKETLKVLPKELAKIRYEADL